MDLSGVLLHVNKKFNPELAKKGHFMTGGFQIQRLNPNSRKWYPLNDLGIHSVFLGTCTSFSTTNCAANGLKENSIYFTDHFPMDEEFGRCTFRDIGIYNMRDGSVERIEHLNEQWPLPIWIVPSAK